MSLFKKAGSRYWWAVFEFKKRRFQFSTKMTNKSDAADYERSYRTNLARGEVGLVNRADGVTIGELLDRLKAHYELHHKDSAQNLSHVKRAKADFGGQVASQLTAAAVETYQTKRQKNGDAAASVNRTLEVVKRAYSLAGIAPPRITKLEENNTRQGFFTRPDFDRVLEHLPENLRDFVLWSFLTGMRRSESKSLCWSCVTDNVIRLPGVDAKTKKPRTIVCVGELGELLERRKQVRTVILPSGAVMAATHIFHHNGQRVGEFRKSWATACRLAGCPEKLFHDLRRSGVRNLIRAGVAQNVAMKISGHRTISVFNRYDICNEEDLAQAMVSLQKYHEAERKKIVAISATR